MATDLGALNRARQADQSRWERQQRSELNTLRTTRTAGQMRPTSPMVAGPAPRAAMPRPTTRPSRQTTTTTTPRTRVRKAPTATFKDRPSPKGEGGGGGLFGGVWKNLAGGGQMLWSLPVGAVNLWGGGAVDLAKTAVDVGSEAVEDVANLEGLAPWQVGDIYDPGHRAILAEQGASLRRTGATAQQFADLLYRGQTSGTPIVAAPTGPLAGPEGTARENRLRETVGMPPVYTGSWGESDYPVAWQEGQFIPKLVEDLGNVALIAGGTGIALKGAGTVGRAGFTEAAARAAARGQAAGPLVDAGLTASEAATRAGTAIRDTPLTGARGRREARALRRADAMENLIGLGESISRQGSRLDRTAALPVSAPFRALRGVAGAGYNRLLDSSLAQGVIENPNEAGNRLTRTARYAAQSFEASAPMRELAERGQRRTRGSGAMHINVRNIITGGDRSPTLRRAADEGIAAYLMLRQIPDPDAIVPGLRDQLDAHRDEAAARVWQMRRNGETIDRARVQRINQGLKPLAESVSETTQQNVSPNTVALYDAWRRGEQPELLARYDDAFRAAERRWDEELESNDTYDYVDPDVTAAEKEFEAQGIDPLSVHPTDFQDMVEMKREQRVRPLQEMYGRVQVPEPNPQMRLLENDVTFSEAQRGNEILPPRYNFELADTLKAEQQLLGPAKERERLVSRRDRYQQTVAKADPELAKAARDVFAGRQFLEQTRQQFDEGSPQVAAAEAERTLREQVLQDAISRNRLAPQLVTPGGRLLAGARNRQRFTDRLIKLYEASDQSTNSLRADLQAMSDRFDTVQQDARSLPSRYRTAMHHVTNQAKDLGVAARELEAIGLDAAADVIRQEAQALPVYVADLIERSGDQNIRYVPGGRARIGSGGKATERLAGLRFKETGVGDWTVAGQAAIAAFRNAEIVRAEAETWLANSPHTVTIQSVLGMDDTSHSSLAPGELVRQMEDRGYKLAREVDKGSVDVSTPFVPKAYRAAYDAYFNPARSDTTLARWVDREKWVMQKWKRGTLGLSPRWLVGNVVGNALQAKVQGGVNFRDMPGLFRDSAALHYKLRGLTQENLTRGQELLVGKRRAADLDGTLGDWLENGSIEALASVYSHELRVNPELGDYGLQRLMADARNRAMASDPNATPTQVNLAVQGAVRDHLVDSFDGTADSWRHHPLSTAIDKSFKINTFFDDTTRGMVFLDQLGKKGGPTKMTPQIAEQSVEAALRMIGNFDSMTAFEKRYVRQVFPFWSWMRHITAASARLPINHPMRTAWYLHLATVGLPEDYYDESVFTRGAFPLGNDRFAPLGYFNPWTGGAVSQMWDTGEDDPISAALAMTAQNLTPIADYGAELFLGETFADAGPGDLMKPLTTDKASLPYNEYGTQPSSVGLLQRALGGDVAPLLYRTANYNPVSRLARDEAATLLDFQKFGETVRRYPTGEVVRKQGEPIPSGDSLFTPTARYTGFPLPPGDLLFDTRQDQERRLAAKQAAADR